MLSLTEETSVQGLKRYCTYRYRHADILQTVMLDCIELLLQGKRALFLEKEECADLREELLWIFFSFKIPLVSPLK